MTLIAVMMIRPQTQSYGILLHAIDTPHADLYDIIMIKVIYIASDQIIISTACGILVESSQY